MTINELRIGNYVLYEDELWQVNMILRTLIEIRRTKNPYFYYKFINHINPVLLTKQWLIDFGFIEDLYGLTKEKIQIKIMNGFCNVYFRNLIDEENDVYSEWVFLRRIRFVHQIQNLYFNLTGGELKNDKKRS